MLHRKQNLTYIDHAYINTYTEKSLRLVESTVEDGVLRQCRMSEKCRQKLTQRRIYLTY